MAASRCSFFLLGLGVGTAIGVLFAPKEGEQMRVDIRSRANESRDYLRRRSSELRHQAEDIIDRGRGAFETQRGQLSAALEAGRQAYREATRVEGENESKAEPA